MPTRPWLMKTVLPSVLASSPAVVVTLGVVYCASSAAGAVAMASAVARLINCVRVMVPRDSDRERTIAAGYDGPVTDPLPLLCPLPFALCPRASDGFRDEFDR